MKSVWPLGFAVVLASCASLNSAPDGEPNYSSDAEENLRLGNEALASQSYIEAGKYFEYVRSKFPFLEAARTASLRLADLDFEREQYLEARDRYRSFMKQYPTHPRVDYAAFRAAYTFYKEAPSDFFLLPPSSQKEQVSVKGTLNAMSDFLAQYPTSPHAPEAQKLLSDTRERLARHEMYVADFYARRARWPAVVARLRVLLDTYPGVGLTEEAYWKLHDAFLKMEKPDEARRVLEDIQKALPNTPSAQRAQRLMTP